MAMKPSEAAASVNANNNTETQYVAYSYQFTADLTRLIGSYMDDTDLKNFLDINFILFSSQACQEDIDNRKYVREKILPYIFNAAPHLLEAFLKQPLGSMSLPPDSMSIPQMLLTKASFNEGYVSETLGGKFVCIRPWLGVSALTAAAYSGDFSFAVLQIIAPLLKADENRSLSGEEDSNSYRVQAMRQLQEVEKRITEQTMKDFSLLSEAVNAIVDMYFGKDKDVKQAAERRLAELQKSEEFKRLIEDQSIVEEAIAAGFTPRQDFAKPSVIKSQEAAVVDPKATSERKEKAENAPIKYADGAEFLTPVLRHLKAYINFIIQHSKLYEKRELKRLDNLWEVIGECHKRLFRNVLQEYFDPEKPFSPDAPVDFNREPSRAPCVYMSGDPWKLDGLGWGTKCGINKCAARGGAWGAIGGQPSWTMGWDRRVAGNLGAITPYFKHRTTGLQNIIEQLKTSSSAAELVVAYANNSKAAKKP